MNKMLMIMMMMPAAAAKRVLLQSPAILLVALLATLATLATAAGCTTETAASAGEKRSSAADSSTSKSTDARGGTTDAPTAADTGSGACRVDSKGQCPGGCDKIEVWKNDPIKKCLLMPLTPQTIACTPSPSLISGAEWCYERLDGSDVSLSPGIYAMDAADLAAQGWRACSSAIHEKAQQEIKACK